jgi:hypothetical protein
VSVRYCPQQLRSHDYITLWQLYVLKSVHEIKYEDLFKIIY